MKNKKNIFKLFMIALLIITQSCKKDFLDTRPNTQQSPDEIKTISDLQVVLNGAYNLLQSRNYLNGNTIYRHDVRSDDMQTPEVGRLEDEYFYLYETDDMNTGMWSLPYTTLRHVNNTLEISDRIEGSNDAEIVELQDIKGQALAIRALSHFTLCNFFALPYSHNGGSSLGVPIITTVLDLSLELNRNTVAEVYTQIIADLNAAIPLLSTAKKGGKINAWTAKALLARVYLYKEDNANALLTAKDIIDNGPYSLVSRSNYVDSWQSEFSSEDIFRILNSTDDNGGSEGVCILSDPEGYGQFVASQDLIDLMRTDLNDIRNEILYIDQISTKGDPTTYGRVLKYPGKGNTKAKIVAHALASSAVTNNVTVFRLSEMYLIAAEAAVKTSNPVAETYLNAIVERANPAATVLSADVTLDRVLIERRKELVAEGHRFLDLIRNKKDIVRSLSSRVFSDNIPLHIKYDNYKVVFPIPRTELNTNSNIEQNPGYDK